MPPGPCPQRLACVQHTVEQCWSHSFRGRINGVEFDFQGYKAHWEALQASVGSNLNLRALGRCSWAVVLHSSDCTVLAKQPCARPAPTLLPNDAPFPQDALSTLLVEVRELVVSRSSVGVVYDVLCGRRGERQPAQLRAVAVIDVGPDGRIASSQAVVRLVSGSPADESLATLMPDS